MLIRGHVPVGTALLALLLFYFGQPVEAQSFTPFLSQPPPNGTVRQHMSPTGKACVTLTKNTKQETVNKDIYQHWINATNTCGQLIKLKVCYYGTRDCVALNAPPYGKQSTILGIFPALKDFRYSYTEQF